MRSQTPHPLFDKAKNDGDDSRPKGKTADYGKNKQPVGAQSHAILHGNIIFHVERIAATRRRLSFIVFGMRVAVTRHTPPYLLLPDGNLGFPNCTPNLQKPLTLMH
jgi:hypothetical protein